MVKFDDFTNKHLKYFMGKREKHILPTLKEKRSLVSNFIKNNKVNFKIEDYEISNNKINKLADTQWVYKELLNSLDNLDSNYKITWLHKNITNCIFIKSTKDKFNCFKQRLDILLPMLNYLMEMCKAPEERKIQMYLILSHLKKELIEDEIVSPKHINSGYTDFISNEIFIWREEEFEKVIFHEMIHYMDLDVRNMSFEDTDLPIIIKGPKSYYEAFTDIQGIMYYLIYISILTGKSVNSLFQIEYQFIKNQANKLNDIFNLDDWNNEISIDSKKSLNQNSPAFTYYIIKYLIIKKIVEEDNFDLINKPKELIKEIFKTGFQSEKFKDLNSSRMTLIQIK